MAKVLYILSGPTYDPDASLSARFKILSKHHSGAVVTTNSVLDPKRYGAFDVKFSLYDGTRKWHSIREHYRLAKQEALAARRSGQPYDIVVSYDPLKTGLMAWLIARAVGARFITEVNGVYQSPFEWMDDGPFKGPVKRRLYMLVERFVLSRAHGIKLLFPEQLRGVYRAPACKPVRSFFNYVDTQRFAPGPDEKYLLFVGFPFFRKGVDLLLEAYSRIAPDCPGWRLQIIGWLQPPDIARIDEYRQRTASIEYSKPVLHAAMPDRISRCSCLVLPSRSEGMGRVLVEAMACGKPRVGSNIEGIPTVIRDGHDGFLFESENTDELARKLRLLMTDDALRARLGENARVRHRDEFSAEKYLEHLDELFMSVIGPAAPVARSPA